MAPAKTLAPTRFRPLRRASRERRRTLLIVGPLLWLASLVVVAFVVHHGDSVGYALLVLAASFALALPTLAWMRVVRKAVELER
jgi:hypothetical protein